MARPQKGTPVQDDGTKVCSKCLEQKTAEEFNASANTRDGKDPQCKQCKRAQHDARKGKRKKRTRRKAKK